MSGPDRLGPYELGALLAEGGTSTVYAAIRGEGSYQRPVAIKVLRQDLAGTEAAHRFRAERQILARLEHPHIARLYDGGTTPDGRPFLVMERIDGLPLDAWCEARRLGVEARLRLFLKVCGAVQHAHRNLLVHRDLKPSNILVDAAGEPKLLDFGIAKQMPSEGSEAQPATRFDTTPLTPSYASPEQLRAGAITTTSDVYSLGVLLYRLLTGASPYGATSERELERAICEEQPLKPSEAVSATTPKLARRLRGDLDTIVLKALAKEPERRYRSVADLAEDLERHLANRPIAARPDTAAYLAWKFTRRHRAGVAFSCLVVALLAAWIVDLELRQRRLAREKGRAQKAFTFLLAAFQNAAPTLPGTPTPALAIIDSAANSLGSALAGEPAMQARLMSDFGQAYWDQRRFPEACGLFGSALAIREHLPDVERGDLAESLLNVALCRDANGQVPAALEAVRRSIVHLRTLGAAKAKSLSNALNVEGEILGKARAFAQAEPALAEAVAVERRARKPDGLNLAHHLVSLALVELELGRDGEAERLAREAGAILSRAPAGASWNLAFQEQKLAAILGRLGAGPEAEARLRRIVDLQRSAGIAAFDRASALTTLARTLAGAGKLDEAVLVGRERLALSLGTLGASHVRTASAQRDLADILARQGQAREGEALALQALATLGQKFGRRSPEAGGAYLALACARRGSGHAVEALALARTGLALLEERYGPDDPLLAAPLREIALSLDAQGQDGAALPYLERAQALLARRAARDSARRAEIELPLAEILLRLGRKEEGRTLLRATQARLRVEYGPGDARVAAIQELYRTR